MSTNSEKCWRATRIALAIITLIASAAIAYGILTERVKTNSNTIEKVEQKADTNQLNIVEIKTDIKYIKFGIDDIKEELKK